MYQDLVLAAGPFTSWIFDTLFEGHQMQLGNYSQAAYWFEIGVDDMTDGANVGLRFPTAAVSEPQLEDEVSMVLRLDDNLVAVSGIATQTVNLPLRPHYALKSSRGSKVEYLMAVSVQYLDKEIDVGDESLAARGRHYLSTANSGNPLIDRIPSSGLGKVCEDAEEHNSCGVWLCYGFGKYGTTLAPGAARMLVNKMLRGRTEYNDYDFSRPIYEKPRAKGKAAVNVRS